MRHENDGKEAQGAMASKDSRREVLVSSDVLDPARVLATALQSIRRTSDADQIYMEWPNLHKMSVKMVRYLSPIYPGTKGGPLIEECLRQAVESYLAVDRAGGEDGAKVGAFMTGLVQNAHWVFETLIYVQHQDKRWRAWEYFSQPVTDWLLQNAASRVLAVRADSDAHRPDPCLARAFMFAHIATPTDFKFTGNILDRVYGCCKHEAEPQGSRTECTRRCSAQPGDRYPAGKSGRKEESVA